MNKKGFTLIELLAVIIILGILMIIAIPSVTRYISDSRKNAYVDTAKEIISGARNMVNEGKLEMYDTDTTYYIDSSCIKTENASKSPYGDFTKAYVVVTYDGKGYDYYWTSVDDAGQGVRNITRLDKLDESDIESDLKESDIYNAIGIDNRNHYVLIDNSTNCQKGESNDIIGSTNSENGNVELTSSGLIMMNSQSSLVKIDNGIYIFNGGNPNNYVYFNGDTWRIVGLYNGNLKIMSWTNAGYIKYNNYSYDGNEWEGSNVKNYLNNDYYNSMTETAKEMIENGTWNVGSSNTSSNAIQSYSESKSKTWVGKVGLISNYEFLYASSRNNCQQEEGSYNGYVGFGKECGKKQYDWLSFFENYWTISQSLTSNCACYVVSYAGDSESMGVGYVSINNVNYSYSYAYPVVYLKSSVKITGGTGTFSDPYTLGL